MKKIQAYPYKIYRGSDNKIIVFNCENLFFAEVSPLHILILKKMRFFRKFPTDLSLLRYNKKEIDEAFEDLNELGFFTPVKISKKPIFYLKPRIKGFRIVLTEECNLGCTECFVTKHHQSLGTFSREVFNSLVEKTIFYGKKERITYHFFGGEPLIRFDYIKEGVKRINTAVQQGEMIKPIYAITTNLTLLNKEMIEMFKKNDFKVGVSIDGPKEINDKFRIYKGGQGSFKNVKRNYSRLVAAGIDAHVLITPHIKFLDRLVEIFQGIIKCFPMKTITVNTPLHYRTLAWNVPGDKYAKILIELAHIAKKSNITLDSALSPIIASLSNNVKRESPCMFKDKCIMASVNPKGCISFCAQNWHNVLAVNSVKKIKIPVNITSKCEHCQVRYICGGPCPIFQLISGEKIDKQKCKFMYTIIKEIAENIGLFQKT